MGCPDLTVPRNEWIWAVIHEDDSPTDNSGCIQIRGPSGYSRAMS